MGHRKLKERVYWRLVPNTNVKSNLSWAHHEGICISECILPLTFNFSFRWVVSCSLRPLYCQGNNLRCPLNRRPDDPRASLEHLEEKNSCCCRISSHCFWLSNPYTSHCADYVVRWYKIFAIFVWPARKSLNRPGRNYRTDCKKVNKMQRKMWSSGRVAIMCKLLRFSHFAKDSASYGR